MKTITLTAALAAAISTVGCATHAPQPAVYPGSATGYLEYVNETTETQAMSAVRCGAENHQTYVVLDAPATTVRVEPGRTGRVELTTGCYTVFAGPDRMSTQGRQHSVQIPASDQGRVEIRSSGQQRSVAN